MATLRSTHRARLLRRPRHLRHPALADRALPGRGGRVLRRPRPGRGARPGSTSKARAHRRRRSASSTTCARSSCATSSSRCCAPARSTRAGYLLGTSIARPLIAKRQVEIAARGGRRRGRARRHRQGQRPGALRAHLLRARARAHGHRAVARRGTSTARADLIAYAEQQRHPDPGDRARSRTAPTATCCTSATRAASSRIPGASRTTTCSSSRSRPSRRPTSRSTSRSSSRPATRCAVNGERALARGAARAAQHASPARHGVGRVDLVENRYVGMKSRGVYETPGRHRAARRASAPSSR